MRQIARTNIRLYIDRLILDGLPVERMHAPQVQEAVEVELTRLLSEQGLGPHLEAGGAAPSVPTHNVQFTTGSTPRQIGTQIAQSVYSGIGNKQ